jgi:hypothetical protein
MIRRILQGSIWKLLLLCCVGKLESIGPHGVDMSAEACETNCLPWTPKTEGCVRPELLVLTVEACICSVHANCPSNYPNCPTTALNTCMEIDRLCENATREDRESGLACTPMQVGCAARLDLLMLLLYPVIA